MFDRITFDPKIMGGRACIRGMRIPVSVIVGQVAHGASFEEILEGYPDLGREDIQQAVEYVARDTMPCMCANTAWRDLATTTSSSRPRWKTASWYRQILISEGYSRCGERRSPR
jgi:uncharacterized protein (DUF433 family)